MRNKFWVPNFDPQFKLTSARVSVFTLPRKHALTAHYFDVSVHFLSNTLRRTRAAAVKGLDEQSMNRDEVFVGQKGKDFDFADLRGMKIEFIECSAKGDDESDLKEVHAWLNKLI